MAGVRLEMNGQNVLGFLMILAGLALTCGGVIVLVRGNAPEHYSPTTAKSYSPPPRAEAVLAPEKNLTPEEKGYAFEKWVVEKFNKSVFHIKEWRSDKQVNGHYAESSRYPDLEIEFKLRDRRSSLAMECKWRKSFYSRQNAEVGIEWATPQQIEVYQKYQRERDLPVFVAIGIGGEPDNPAEFYVVPLDRLKYPFASSGYLAKFRRPELAKKFYYDDERSELR